LSTSAACSVSKVSMVGGLIKGDAPQAHQVGWSWTAPAQAME
jgi:hypothetical protein